VILNYLKKYIFIFEVNYFFLRDNINWIHRYAIATKKRYGRGLLDTKGKIRKSVLPSGHRVPSSVVNILELVNWVNDRLVKISLSFYHNLTLYIKKSDFRCQPAKTGRLFL